MRIPWAWIAAAAALGGLNFSGLESAIAQPDTRTPLDQVVARVLESRELQVLAAGLVDTIGGRLSGTPTGTRAEAWAAQWLRHFGFDSVWFEPVRIPAWRRGVSSVRVVAPPTLRHRELVAVLYGHSPGITADSAALIDIGRSGADRLERLGERVEGAALLTDGMVSPELIERAAELKAAAVLRIAFEPGRLPQARLAPAAEPPAPVAILSVSREDGLWLRRQAAAGPLSLGLRLEAETRTGTVLNVVGEWRGGDPAVRDEVVLVGAHLDSWDLGDGAIDNGSGVLAALVGASSLAQLETRPRRTVRVVLFAAEEFGLLGSREYVRAHAAELPNIVAMMNLDMVGQPQGYGATGHSEADTLFARLVRESALAELGMADEVEHGGGAGSDHQPFVLAGVPTTYVRTSLPPDAPLWYHNAGDTLDKVDLEAVRASAAAVAAALWALADHPGRPLRHLSQAETRQLVMRLGW